MGHHVGGLQVRAMLPHGRQCDHWHVLRCVVGSAFRLGVFSSIAVRIPSIAATSVVATNKAILTREAIKWTLGQHSIDAIHDAFDRGGSMPRDHRIISQWPDGSTVGHALRRMLKSTLPFSSANDGLHNMWDPKRVAEAGVEQIC